jgi:hypothetical protein
MQDMTLTRGQDNALQMAKVESEKGIVATYYFRKSMLSFNEAVVRGIVELGHEIGYHYEDLAEVMEIPMKLLLLSKLILSSIANTIR